MLVCRQEISKDLGWMIIIRETIPYRNAGEGCEILDDDLVSAYMDVTI